MQAQDTNEYEAPEIRTVGSVFEFTQTGKHGHGDWCFFNKTWGEPDYWQMIPIANCS